MILRFPGQVADAHSALYYNYFRDYDPETGRYVESDPIGLKGGLNTYGYVNANPLIFIDEFGLQQTTVDKAITQAISRGDVAELQTIMEATASPAQNAIIRRALTPARDLIRGKTRQSASYASELEGHSYAEICKLAKGSGEIANKAKKMKKLIEQQERLHDKL
ncbi:MULTISPECIES: RHS repeat-associated core domain-containing protein [unclassified Pseudomonas]|uniref:RHS repeat-associated core domain-containing protein n=1 Tax=Pseudomonas sp. Pc102 TaxID=2678261 RepID=UPI001FD03F92|nr:RHS repeat-associated core domain-containing protein [Pseudomonas sp. Pc102]